MKLTQRMREASMTTRVLGIAAGTALLGVAAAGVADAAAGHGRRPPAATLAALSHPRLSSGSAAQARRPLARSRSERAAKQAGSGGPGRSGGSGGSGRSGVPPREGRVISTGIKDAGGEMVFYGVRIHAQQLPGVTFGIMAGVRDPAGGLTPEVETNETQGSPSSAGFHAVEAASSVGSPAVAVPEFGYYAGPAATITAREGGRQVQAHLARWSANPRIVIFWFSPSSTASAPDDLAAYSRAGHKLPAGNSSPGHG